MATTGFPLRCPCVSAGASGLDPAMGAVTARTGKAGRAFQGDVTGDSEQSESEPCVLCKYWSN